MKLSERVAAGTGGSLLIALILLASAGCGGPKPAVPAACIQQDTIDWACVSRELDGSTLLVETDRSVETLRKAVLEAAAQIKSGDRRRGRENLTYVLRQQSDRKPYPAPAWDGGLVLLAQQLVDHRWRAADTVARLLEQTRVLYPIQSGTPSDWHAQQLWAARRAIPTFVARALVRDGLPPADPRELLSQPLAKAAERGEASGRILITRLRLMGADWPAPRWGELDLFQLALEFALYSIDRSVQPIPLEAVHLLCGWVGRGVETDGVAVAEILTGHAWALGCSNVIVARARHGARLLEASTYPLRTPPNFEGLYPIVLPRASLEPVRLDEGDILSGVGPLATWIAQMFGAPGRADRIQPPPIPHQPRTQLCELAAQLAIGNGWGAHRICEDLRRAMAGDHELANGTAFIDYADRIARSQMEIASLEGFRDGIIEAMITR